MSCMTSASSLLALLVVLTAIQANLAAPNGDVLKDAAVVTNTAAEGEATTAATTLADAEVAARKEATDKLAARHTSEKDAHKTHDDAIQTQMGAEEDTKRTYGEDIALSEADAKKNEITKARKQTAEEKQAHDVKQELRRERRWNYTNQIRQDQLLKDKTGAELPGNKPVVIVDPYEVNDDLKVKEARDNFNPLTGFYEDTLDSTTQGHEPDPHGDINPHPFDRQTFKAYAAMVKNDKEDLHGEGQQLYRKGTLLSDHLFRYQQILSKTANMYITMMQKVKKSLEMEHDSMLNNEKHRMVPMADITNTIKVMLEADDQNKAIHNLVVDPRLVKHMQLRHLNQTYVNGAAGDGSGRPGARALTSNERAAAITAREEALKVLHAELEATPDADGMKAPLTALATAIYDKGSEQQIKLGCSEEQIKLATAVYDKGSEQADCERNYKTLRFHEDPEGSGWEGYQSWTKKFAPCVQKMAEDLETDGPSFLAKVWLPENLLASDDSEEKTEEIQKLMQKDEADFRLEKNSFVDQFVIQGIAANKDKITKETLDACTAEVGSLVPKTFEELHLSA